MFQAVENLNTPGYLILKKFLRWGNFLNSPYCLKILMKTFRDRTVCYLGLPQDNTEKKEYEQK